MYGMAMPGVPTRYGAFVRVDSVGDLAHLIKERELLFGKKGRRFIARVHDADIEYDVCALSSGFEVTEKKTVGGERQYFVAAGDLHRSMLGQSISYGRLYTAAV